MAKVELTKVAVEVLWSEPMHPDDGRSWVFQRLKIGRISERVELEPLKNIYEHLRQSPPIGVPEDGGRFFVTDKVKNGFVGSPLKEAVATVYISLENVRKYGLLPGTKHDLTMTLECRGVMLRPEAVEVERVPSEGLVEWFDESPDDRGEDTAEFPKLTLEEVLVTFHRDRPQFCHIGRMFGNERDSIVQTFDTDYAHSIAGKYPSLTREEWYGEDILLRTERCCGIMPGVVYLMRRITFVRRWGRIFINDFEVDTAAYRCRGLNPVYFDSWRGTVPQATEDTHGGADERSDDSRVASYLLSLASAPSLSIIPLSAIPNIKDYILDVIFNGPAVTVKWADGTKTTVKAQNGETIDPEKGFAMAVTKKVFGNNREYYHTVLHWLKKSKK